MRERVTRGGDRSDLHPRPDPDDLTVAHRRALEGHLILSVDEVGSSGAPRERESAGDVVVVDMGLEDVSQPQALLVEQAQDSVDVPLGVHHEGDLAVVHEIAAVAQRGRVERDNRDHPGPPRCHPCRIPPWVSVYGNDCYPPGYSTRVSGGRIRPEADWRTAWSGRGAVN